MTGRWVLHVDLDEFIAAVEILRRPELRGRPVVVGGRGDPSERAVVSTASYAAREYGVGSGMPLKIAARKLKDVPDAVFLPVDADEYSAASAVVMDTLRGFDAVVEVLGWDEAFLGVVTDDPEALAERIRAAILDATGLHASVGIGDNKLRAKIATGFGKPRGVFRLTAATWFDVMGERPTDALWGIGSRTAKRLARHGITTVRELAAADDRVLAAEFGPKMGPWIGTIGRGSDTSPVTADPWIARSHSRETTFPEDLTDWSEVAEHARRLAAVVTADIVAEDRPGVRVGLKVRYAPFETHTVSAPLADPTLDPSVVADAAVALTDRLDHARAVRLLGVRVEMAPPRPHAAGGEVPPSRRRL
ncbi:DNA polymerase IV [Rhodococcus sp. HNM0569]|uniref:DNA polymerase IV n=1 Tax=Rhodococcus sp. HNM0569 TaxID=2716340 RepID=UPI00146A4A55|nr:DNA polymerase IV [Rhodococcus sp. HNM0569]NLU82820.1 DNA polymerase IV [Rhodococcus sp. HNM0569]